MKRKTQLLGIALAYFIAAPVSTWSQPAPEENWTWRNPLPHGFNFYSAAQSPNGISVAVGEYGLLARVGADGNLTQIIPGTEATLPMWAYDVFYTGVDFLISSRGGQGVRSIDGNSWVPYPPMPANFYPQKMVATNARTVGFGGTGDYPSYVWTSWTSSDPQRRAWTSGTLPAPKTSSMGWSFASYNDLTSNPSGSLFVAVGTGGTIATSTNGTAWTTRSSGTTADFEAIVFNGSQFFAFGKTIVINQEYDYQEYKPVLFTSANGTAWTPALLPPGFSFNTILGANNGKIYAVKSSYNSQANSMESFLISSEDGSAWQEISSLPYMNGVAATFSNDGSVYLFAEEGWIGKVAAGADTVELLSGENLLGQQAWITQAVGIPGVFITAESPFPSNYSNHQKTRSWHTSDFSTFTEESPSNYYYSQSATTIYRAGLNNAGNLVFEETQNGTSWQQFASVNLADYGLDITSQMKLTYAVSGDRQVFLAAISESYESNTNTYARTYRYLYKTASGGWSQLSGADPTSSYSSYTIPDFQVQWDGTKFVILDMDGRLWSYSGSGNLVAYPSLPSHTAAQLRQYFSPGSNPPAANFIAHFIATPDKIVAIGRKNYTEEGQLDPRAEGLFVFQQGSWQMVGLDSGILDYWLPYKEATTPLAYSGSHFIVATGLSDIFTSPDGITWTKRRSNVGIDSLLWDGQQLVGRKRWSSIIVTHPTGLFPAADYVTVDTTPRTISPEGGASNAVTISVSSDISWTASRPSTATWLTVTPASGSGDGTVTITAQPNNTLLSRSTTVTIGGKVIPITQPTFITADSAERLVPKEGEEYQIVVNATRAWRMINPAAAWVTVLNSDNQVIPTNSLIPQGTATLTIRVLAQPENVSIVNRRVTLSLGGLAHIITQEGFMSADSLTRQVPRGGETYTVVVNSTRPWRLTNPATSWVTATTSREPVNGLIPAGETTVTLVAAAQPNSANPAVRTASISLGGLAHVITQEAALRTVANTANSFTIPVTAPAGTSWTAAVDGESVDWLTLSPSSGVANGTVQVNIARNPTSAFRTADLIINGLRFAIRQHGQTTISSPSNIVGHGAESYTVTVTSTMPWRITNPATWVTVTTNPAASGGLVPAGEDIVVTFNVNNNLNPLPRTAAISLGGVIHTLTQAPAPRSVNGALNTFTAPINATGSWTVTIPEGAGWIIPSRNSGTGRGSVTLTMAENPTTSSRTATVTIDGVAYEITQQGQTLSQLHRGTYTGVVFANGGVPTLPSEGAESVFDAMTDAKGGVTITVTPTPTGATYSATLRHNLRTYTGRGTLVPDPATGTWKITSATWTSAGRPALTATVDLEFIVDQEITKLVRGAIEVQDSPENTQSYALLAGKQVFEVRSNPFLDAGTYVTSLGSLWKAVGTCTMTRAGVAQFAGHFVDGTAFTFSAPWFGATGLAGEQALLLYAGVYANQGWVAAWRVERPDADDPNVTILAQAGSTSVLPRRLEMDDILSSFNESGSLREDSASEWLLHPYVAPAANSPVMQWPLVDGTTTLEVFASVGDATVEGPLRYTGRTNAFSWLQTPNTNRLTLQLNARTGYVTGTVTVPVSHPETGAPLGTRAVRLFGIAVQDFEIARSMDRIDLINLSPSVPAAGLFGMPGDFSLQSVSIE